MKNRSITYRGITYGSNMHDIFLIPTIRIERNCEMRYLTIEWLKWYVGICWEVEY